MAAHLSFPKDLKYRKKSRDVSKLSLHVVIDNTAFACGLTLLPCSLGTPVMKWSSTTTFYRLFIIPNGSAIRETFPSQPHSRTASFLCGPHCCLLGPTSTKSLDQQVLRLCPAP